MTRLFGRRFTSLVAMGLLVAGRVAAAQEAPPAGANELRRRLEQAEARIAELEETLKLQAQRIDALLTSSGAGSGTTSVASAGAGAPAVAAAAPPGPQAPSVPTSPTDPPEARPITHQAQAVKFTGLVQAWYFLGNKGQSDTFRIRRTELYFSGDINKKAHFQVMIDPAKALALETSTTSIGGTPVLGAVSIGQSSRMLQNAFVALDYIPKVQMNIGQYKLPMSLEGLQSSGQLETVERALFTSDRSRGGNYGDVRDIGFMLRGGLGKRVDFQAGVFNGIAESQNTTDVNDEKALVGRLVARPFKGLHIGMSGGWDNGSETRPRRERLGGELEYKRGAFHLKSELMTGEDGPLSRRGFYGHVGYRIRPRFEWVFRVDGWDPDTSSEALPATVSELDYVTGFNFLISKHNLKVQANYLRKTFGSDALESRNVLLINTQTFW